MKVKGATPDAVEKALPKRRLKSRVLSLEVTDERDYTCDYCGATFPTIGHLRLHLGKDPAMGRQTLSVACTQQCRG